MALSDKEIRRRLTKFAAAWGGYQGTEKAEAQTFCNELLACYGTDRKRVAQFEERTGAGGFIDLIWPEVCLIEMKRPSEATKLETHRFQGLEYWKEVSRKAAESGQSAPEWIVICAFERFLVLDPDAGWDKPVDDIPLAELPERMAALRFLVGQEPHFRVSQADLSREAVAALTDLYQGLRQRKAADPDELRAFILQLVWCMFAEDLGILPEDMLRRALEGLIKDPKRSSADDLGQLFQYLAEEEPRPPTGSVYAKTPFANGGLFKRPARVHLSVGELTTLREACDLDWRQVEPAIFGSILQGALGKEKRWALGAHYTAEADIMKVVRPTVVDPWRKRIEGCGTVGDAEAAWRDLMSFVVLDPACGSGNFLYVAYTELRRIEAQLRERLAELRVKEGVAAQEKMEFFPISNMKGLEIELFAVELAHVVLWMGHKLAADEMKGQGLNEPTLPLADLSGVRRADALRTEWPQADAIVSNPPYHGSQLIREELGEGYVDFLRSEFGIGVKDYAVYWFRKTHGHLPHGGRAGLVATNSVTQNRNRKPSLEWIADHGGVITDAVSRQEWTGDATVNVSIVNWVREPPGEPAPRMLDGIEVNSISPSLTPGQLDLASAARLPANADRCFQGPIPAGAGFVLDEEEALGLLSHTDVDYKRVVKPWMTAQDIAEHPRQQASRWIIDFGEMSLEGAASYPDALEIVRARVKPMRDRNRDRGFRARWWLFGRPRGKLRQMTRDLDRYVAGTRHGVRLHFCWCSPPTLASDATNAFVFSDDYSMGILCSRAHGGWAWAQSSTIREDIRYTPTSAFATFPWPDPSNQQRNAIREICERLFKLRSSLCLNRGIGLTQLYNEVTDGAHQELADLHTELDRAVVAAYGWPAAVAKDRDESNRRLLELNKAVAEGQVDYQGPG